MILMLNSKCIAFYGLSPHHAPRDDEPNNHYWSYLLHNTRCTAQCTIRTKREMGKSRKFSYCRLCRLSHWFEGVDFSEDFSHYAVVGDLLAVTMGFFRRQRVHINNECNRQQKCHSILQWRFGSQGGRPALLSPSLEAFLPSQCTSKPQRSYCGDCEWTTLGWQKHIFYFPRDNNQSVHLLV